MLTSQDVLPTAARATSLAETVRRLWQRFAPFVLFAAATFALCCALVRITHGFWRLVYWHGFRHAIDLRFRKMEIEAWFAGQPVYGAFETADYPPASYAMLWPLIGWSSVDTMRLIWALTMLGMLAWLAIVIVRASGADNIREKAVLALLPFGTYAIYDTMHTGQLVAHTLPLLAVGLPLLALQRASFKRDVAGASLLIPALVKPSLSVPFFWAAFFAPRRLRPGLLIIGGYVALTLFAAAFQDAGPIALIRAWFDQSGKLTPTAGSANLHAWFDALGISGLVLPAALLLLLATGWWTFRHRATDIWVLAAVGAIVSRLWMIHRAYDDFLIIIAVAGAWRCAHFLADRDMRTAAGVLAAALWASLMVPRIMLTDYPKGAFLVMEVGQPVLWLLTLALMAYAAKPGRMAVPQAARATAAP